MDQNVINIDDIVKPYSSIELRKHNKTFRHSIIELLESAKQRIKIATDQFTDKDIFKLLQEIKEKNPQIDIQIIVGLKNTALEERLFQGAGTIHRHTDRFGIQWFTFGQNSRYKMHNKFIVVDDKVFTGSPNITPTAFNESVESAVILNLKDIADYYNSYFQLMIDENRQETRLLEEQDKKKMRLQRAQFITAKSFINDSIKVCLAPFFDIPTDLLQEEIIPAKSLKASHFLFDWIGNNQVGDWIIHGLPNKHVKIIFDEKQIDSWPWMRKSITKLLENTNNNTDRITLYEASVNGNGSLHDKMFLIKRTEEDKRVIIGSAGITKNVQENNNYENIILIRSKKVYDYFNEKHFQMLIDNKDYSNLHNIKKIERC